MNCVLSVRLGSFDTRGYSYPVIEMDSLRQILGFLSPLDSLL